MGISADGLFSTDHNENRSPEIIIEVYAAYDKSLVFFRFNATDEAAKLGGLRTMTLLRRGNMFKEFVAV